MNYESIMIVIPAYNPDKRLLGLINELIHKGYEKITVINDGSREECNRIFEAIQGMKQCTVLHHSVNLGKGRALKTAFNYILLNSRSCKGVVTVDADGQHAVDDVCRVTEELLSNSGQLILGGRDFYKKGIPFRSRFGNIITKKIFDFLTGLRISDTQTGLRGISFEHLSFLMKIPGERFEYEMNMLMDMNQRKIPLKEIEIETIYIEENKTSSFNPLLDSIRVYLVFLKFIGSSLASFGVDILSFIILIMAFKHITPAYFLVIASVGSRVLSSMFNYLVNRNTVFSARTTSKRSIIKYYILATIQLGLSTAGVSWIYSFINGWEVAIKMAVDLCLSIFSFRVQREWVFKDNKVKMYMKVNNENLNR